MHSAMRQNGTPNRSSFYELFDILLPIIIIIIKGSFSLVINQYFYLLGEETFQSLKE